MHFRIVALHAFLNSQFRFVIELDNGWKAETSLYSNCWTNMLFKDYSSVSTVWIFFFNKPQFGSASQYKTDQIRLRRKLIALLKQQFVCCCFFFSIYIEFYIFVFQGVCAWLLTSEILPKNPHEVSHFLATRRVGCLWTCKIKLNTYKKH